MRTIIAKQTRIFYRVFADRDKGNLHRGMYVGYVFLVLLPHQSHSVFSVGLDVFKTEKVRCFRNNSTN